MDGQGIRQYGAATIAVAGIPALAQALGLPAGQAGILYLVLAGVVGVSYRSAGSYRRVALIQTACWLPWAMTILGAMLVWDELGVLTMMTAGEYAVAVAAMAAGYGVLVVAVMAALAADDRLTGAARRLWRLVGTVTVVPYVTPIGAICGAWAAATISDAVLQGETVAVGGGMVLAAMRVLTPFVAAVMFGGLYFIGRPGDKRRRALAAILGFLVYLAVTAVTTWLAVQAPLSLAAIAGGSIWETAGVIGGGFLAERVGRTADDGRA